MLSSSFSDLSCKSLRCVPSTHNFQRSSPFKLGIRTCWRDMWCRHPLLSINEDWSKRWYCCWAAVWVCSVEIAVLPSPNIKHLRRNLVHYRHLRAFNFGGLGLPQAFTLATWENSMTLWFEAIPCFSWPMGTGHFRCENWLEKVYMCMYIYIHTYIYIYI